MALERRTELKRGKALRRGKRLKPKGAKAEREDDDLYHFREGLRARSGGWCEIRTPACPRGDHPGGHPHHRWPSDRDCGLHDMTRGIWVCPRGHDWIHAHSKFARILGWLRRAGDADQGFALAITQAQLDDLSPAETEHPPPGVSWRQPTGGRTTCLGIVSPDEPKGSW